MSSCQVATDVGEIFHTKTDLEFNFFRFWLEHSLEQGNFIHPIRLHELWRAYVNHTCARLNAKILIVDAKIEFLRFVRESNTDGIWPIIPAIEPSIETKIVRIKRKNTFAQLVSLAVAQKTNIWSVVGLDAEPNLIDKFRRGTGVVIQSRAEAESIRIWIDPSTIITRIEGIIRREERLDASIAVTHKIAEFIYEDLFDDSGSFSDSTCQRCAEILGVDVSSLEKKPLLIKQNSLPFSELIENFDQVSAILENSEYSWMLGVES
jgi:hypothetical protein